ncbi:MAG: hypothetical protein BGO01_10035 [Armatimonadetes bacterium 55-13]|nr:DUF393 domain-containing protein [Armatimonadota bacterium]OJU62738.1 MAG: hypothetical protein BGO01_10035 [Armatimonadetes bacterium 55-13]
MTPMILFYDGLCGFCDKTVQFVLERDHRDQFRFATLQGELAKELLPKHGKNPKDLNTLYLLVDWNGPQEQVLQKSDAARRIFGALGGGAKILSILISLFPHRIRDWGYDRVANIRYRLFGKLDACRIPSPKDRAKFLET